MLENLDKLSKKELISLINILWANILILVEAQKVENYCNRMKEEIKQLYRDILI